MTGIDKELYPDSPWGEKLLSKYEEQIIELRVKDVLSRLPSGYELVRVAELEKYLSENYVLMESLIEDLNALCNVLIEVYEDKQHGSVLRKGVKKDFQACIVDNDDLLKSIYDEKLKVFG